MPRKSPFTAEEFVFFKALKKRRVPFLVVGLSAATLQGAPVVTQDVDLWFRDLASPAFLKAVKDAGGFYVPPFGMNAPLLGGKGLELLDIVTTVHGLKNFDEEYRKSYKIKLEGLELRILPLDRIIQSKKTLGRDKDRAVLPVLKDTLKTIKSKL